MWELLCWTPGESLAHVEAVASSWNDAKALLRYRLDYDIVSWEAGFLAFILVYCLLHVPTGRHCRHSQTWD